MLENCCWRIVVEPAPERDDEKYFCSCFEVSRERKSLLLYHRHHRACSQLGTFFSHSSLVPHLDWLSSTPFIRYKMHEMNELHYVMSQIIWLLSVSPHPPIVYMYDDFPFVLCFFYISTGWLAPSVSWALLLELKNFFFRLLSLVFGWRNKSWKRDVNQQTCHVILMKDKLKTRSTKLEDSAENDEQSVEESAAAWDWHRTIENFFLSTLRHHQSRENSKNFTRNTQHSEAECRRRRRAAENLRVWNHVKVDIFHFHAKRGRGRIK